MEYKSVQQILKSKDVMDTKGYELLGYTIIDPDLKDDGLGITIESNHKGRKLTDDEIQTIYTIIQNNERAILGAYPGKTWINIVLNESKVIIGSKKLKSIYEYLNEKTDTDWEVGDAVYVSDVSSNKGYGIIVSIDKAGEMAQVDFGGDKYGIVFKRLKPSDEIKEQDGDYARYFVTGESTSGSYFEEEFSDILETEEYMDLLEQDPGDVNMATLETYGETEDGERVKVGGELNEQEKSDEIYGEQISAINAWFKSTYDAESEFKWDGKELIVTDKDGKTIETIGLDDLKAKIEKFPILEARDVSGEPHLVVIFTSDKEKGGTSIYQFAIFPSLRTAQAAVEEAKEFFSTEEYDHLKLTYAVRHMGENIAAAALYGDFGKIGRVVKAKDFDKLKDKIEKALANTKAKGFKYEVEIL